MNERPTDRLPLVVVYCTFCGARWMESLQVGEFDAPQMRMSRHDIDKLRRSASCVFCGGAMDAKEMTEQRPVS